MCIYIIPSNVDLYIMSLNVYLYIMSPNVDLYIMPPHIMPTHIIIINKFINHVEILCPLYSKLYVAICIIINTLI